ncbi:MAG: F0F1 ATP synthase subunit A [Atopobiaceae bacterium]|nr:F0F1 ATP synthase subunit A [Atopobiaceae bacterium]MBQ9316358.1 F0F1 ATP synthase subunit A [Atopobiaceae bacterium]
MGELIESFFTTPIFGNTTVGFTVTTFWFLVACIIMVAVIFSYKRSMEGNLVPHGFFANGVEYLVDFVKDDICKGTLGDTWREHFPFLATVFFVVMFGDYVGMIPTWKAGTGTTGITVAIALMSFVYFIYVGMKKKGVFGYIKSLAPEGLMPPIAALVWVIEVFSTFLRLVTLAVRLFCNMFAGHVVMGVFALMTTIFLQPVLMQFTLANLGTGAMSILWMVLLILIYVVELLVCFIQAYIFTLLSAVYVQLAEAEGH